MVGVAPKPLSSSTLDSHGLHGPEAGAHCSHMYVAKSQHLCIVHFWLTGAACGLKKLGKDLKFSNLLPSIQQFANQQQGK